MSRAANIFFELEERDIKGMVYLLLRVFIVADRLNLSCICKLLSASV